MTSELSLFKIWKKILNKIINKKEIKEEDKIKKIEEKILKHLCKDKNKKYMSALKNLSLESKTRKVAKIKNTL
jgi:hypothetical protein